MSDNKEFDKMLDRMQDPGQREKMEEAFLAAKPLRSGVYICDDCDLRFYERKQQPGDPQPTKCQFCGGNLAYYVRITTIDIRR